MKNAVSLVAVHTHTHTSELLDNRRRAWNIAFFVEQLNRSKKIT